MPKRILVVEDTADLRVFIGSILSLEGFDVVMAADGVEGLEQADAKTPDLIITDLAMPRLSGIEMIQQLRAKSLFKSVPILAITSHGMDQAMEAMRVGASRALARPVENHLLLAFVFDLMSKGAN